MRHLEDLVGSKVYIEWTNSNSDWHYYRLDSIDKVKGCCWFRLTGVDDPKTQTKHAGDSFFVPASSVQVISEG